MVARAPISASGRIAPTGVSGFVVVSAQQVSFQQRTATEQSVGPSAWEKIVGVAVLARTARGSAMV